jgi:hypothetical protein
MSINSLKARLLQKKVLAVCIVIVAGIVVAAMFMGQEKPTPIKSPDSVAYDFSKDIDRHGFEWDFSNRVEKQSKDIAQLQEKVESKDNAAVALNDALDEANAQNKELEQRLEALEEKLYAQASKQYRNVQSKNNVRSASFNDASLPEDHISFDNPVDTLPLNAIDDNRFTVHKFELETVNASKHLNIANTIPSNSFIKAKLANGVDVSASQSSQQNPKPVLLTITGWGNLPNGHKLRGLKQCRLHATAWGDMSSERVYLSPDLMTCIAENGDIIETSVQGYVASEDGAAGVRGRMVLRDGDLVRSAVIAGTLSGLGEAFAATQGTNSISPLGSTTTYSPGDVLKVGAGKGVGNGLDMLAKYKIKQAENLQPIIQINGGREVDIVFYTSATIGVVSGNPMPKAAGGNSNNELMNVLSKINQIPGDEN